MRSDSCWQLLHFRQEVPGQIRGTTFCSRKDPVRPPPPPQFNQLMFFSILCTDGLIFFRRPALRGCHQCRQVVLISHLDDIRNRCTPAQCRLFLAPGYNNGSVTFIWPREAADFNLATTYLRVRPCNVGPGSVRVLRL